MILINKEILKFEVYSSTNLVLGTKIQLVKIGCDLDIKIHGVPVDRMEARNLGIIFDSQLRFEIYVLSLVKNDIYRLKVLYKIRKQLLEAARIVLSESLIREVNYELWRWCLWTSRRLLLRTQRVVTARAECVVPVFILMSHPVVTYLHN